MKENIPFLLRPAAKDYLWGGSKLNDDFNLNIDISPFAEAWVCSTHPDGPSALASGKLLIDVLREHPEYLGEHPIQTMEGKIELPILIKLIDANKNLSVQVHPDDEYAAVHENGSLGKSEMWYVLDAKPGAKLVYGFSHDVKEARIRKSIETGKIEKYLNYVKVHKNDVFYIEAGTVHAIGEGTVVVEVQESSNLTYRLYDYNRVGADGRKRELHVDKALEVANLKSSATPRQSQRMLKYKNGCASELLTRCKYFQVERLLLNTEGRKLPEYKTAANSFHALVVIAGCGVVFGDGFSINFFKGDCIFVPAESADMRFLGTAQILDVSC